MVQWKRMHLTEVRMNICYDWRLNTELTTRMMMALSVMSWDEGPRWWVLVSGTQAHRPASPQAAQN